MRRLGVLPFVLAACAADSRPAPFGGALDAPPGPDVLTASPEATVDAPVPIDCTECVTACVTASCPLQAAACQANECDAVPDPFDGGGGDGYWPPDCEAIIACLLANQCNPLAGAGDPCFDACYGPACAEAQAAFDALLTCAVDECTDDCAGCQ
jgi:hypothetical protein